MNDKKYILQGARGAESVMLREVKDPITGKSCFRHTGNANMIPTDEGIVEHHQISKMVRGTLHMMKKKGFRS